ncbi:MAG: hypothetical protein LBH85_03205 [Treponema sp.]|jgi:hypothetical protein|nr:hypothetical protein [Treponema sp.]
MAFQRKEMFGEAFSLDPESHFAFFQVLIYGRRAYGFELFDCFSGDAERGPSGDARHPLARKGGGGDFAETSFPTHSHQRKVQTMRREAMPSVFRPDRQGLPDWFAAQKPDGGFPVTAGEPGEFVRQRFFSFFTAF